MRKNKIKIGDLVRTRDFLHAHDTFTAYGIIIGFIGGITGFDDIWIVRSLQQKSLLPFIEGQTK
jgi:hypothetical protein